MLKPFPYFWSSAGVGCFGCLAVAAALPMAAAHAAGTPAGTDIANTATATYQGLDGTEVSVDSNTVTLRVDELLDVSVASADTGDIPALARRDQPDPQVHAHQWRQWGGGLRSDHRGE